MVGCRKDIKGHRRGTWRSANEAASYRGKGTIESPPSQWKGVLTHPLTSLMNALSGQLVSSQRSPIATFSNDGVAGVYSWSLSVLKSTDNNVIVSHASRTLDERGICVSLLQRCACSEFIILSL